MKIRYTRFLTAPLLLGGIFTSVTAAAQLPDLTISDLRVNQQCQVEVTIQNLGPGQLPATAFYVGTQPNLQVYKNNQPAASWNIAEQSLKPAGGSYTLVIEALNQVVSGTHSFRAVIDKYNIVTEANENNNEMTRSLSCTPAQPDLAITKISFNKDCSARITLKNVGTLNFPNNQYSSVNLYRTIDGASKGYRRLVDIDPTGILKAPGGEVTWTDLPDFKATSSAKYQLAGSGMIVDGNAANNSQTENIPAEGCGVTTYKRIDIQRQTAPRRIEPKLQRKIVP